MIHDTSSFKGIRMQRKDLVTDFATERVLANREDATATAHGFELKMRQVVIQQLVLHTMGRGTCLESRTSDGDGDGLSGMPSALAP